MGSRKSMLMPELSVILTNSLQEPSVKYSTPEKFYNGVRDYIEMCNVQSREVETKRGIQFIEKPFTLTGLCIFLGITKQKFNALRKQPQYKEICEFAELISENYLEEGMLNGKLNVIGSIFSLKNNFGWKENKTEVLNPDVTINIVGADGKKIEDAKIIDDNETIKLIEEAGLNFDTVDGE